MNKIIFSFFFSVFLIALCAADVFACTCELPSSHQSIESQVKKAYQKSSLIFIGEVAEAVEDSNVLSVAVKFKVEKIWRKRFQREIIRIKSSPK